MFRNIISPVQAWLISQGRCVGCGTALSGGSKGQMTGEEQEITCRKCGRIFLRNRKTGRYRRAPISSSLKK
ncbi:hypothetical protein M1271_05205 [Patescibacteria group bacterium]|nr:hypothetical protein [Patescibacteria group bacterium]MCL5797929.1 hypothetical protein [Patescibacteria group bacterium]